jgi:hypothetical protein
MKTTFVLGSILFLIQAPTAGAQRLTTDDPNFSSLSQLSNSIGWYQVSGTKAWSVGDGDANRDGAQCMALLNKVRAAGVPDTRTLDVQWESPEFKPGTHTLAEIRRSCEHVERIGKIKEFERWGILAMQAGTNYRSGADYYRLCLKTYDDIVKAGIPPTERVPDRMIGGAQWSGAIQELRTKWCESGASMASSQTSAKEAPFRKDLKGDKLKIALTYGSVFLPGGVGTSNARKMADASVWFLDLSPPQHCVDGRQVHTIRRYQFDGDQHLVKTTHHDYCGSAPGSAFQ